MATTFGTYNGTIAPAMTWYATYEYTRTSNSNVQVIVTVVGDIINTSSSSYMGTGATVVVTATVNGSSQTYTLKSSSDTWAGNTNDPRSCSFTFNVASTSAGTSIPVSYSVAGSSCTAAAAVPTQSTTFSSPALLYTNPTVNNFTATPSGTNAALSWSAAAGMNNSIKHYAITITNNSTGAYVTDFTTTNTSYTVTGLTPGITYKFNLYAVGTYSNSSTITRETTVSYFGLVWIDNGSTFEAYQVFIDNGSSWDQYIPYIDNGSGWDECN